MASDVMVLLPYTPRADADARGYDDWLRRVDNPFFNSVAGIVHYSNWRVVGADPGFSHFDFMFLDADLADGVWADPAVLAFAAGWTAQWGVAPDSGDLSVNYHSYRLARIAGRSAFDPRGVQLLPGTTPASRLGGSIWQLVESMVGASLSSFYEVAFGPTTASSAAICGSLIAAPAA